MNSKETAKKTWSKIGFGILFVAACFVAMYILMEFHGDVLMVSIAAVLLLIAAYLFLNSVFSDKAKKWIPQEEEEEGSEEVFSGGADSGDFRLRVTKHMKEMESTQKELIDVLKNQNTLIQTQIENLEHEIYMLSEKQSNQAKSIIKFNKENARQLAINERETLEYVMMELKKTIEENGETSVSVAEEASPADTLLEEVSGAELFEVSELPGDDEYEVPDMPDDIDLSELFDIPELYDGPVAEEAAEPEPVAEEIPIPEEPVLVEEEKTEEPAQDPLAGLTADPNAMMTPEDIAKLLEAMGQ